MEGWYVTMPSCQHTPSDSKSCSWASILTYTVVFIVFSLNEMSRSMQPSRRNGSRTYMHGVLSSFRQKSFLRRRVAVSSHSPYDSYLGRSTHGSGAVVRTKPSPKSRLSLHSQPHSHSMTQMQQQRSQQMLPHMDWVQYCCRKSSPPGSQLHMLLAL